MRITPQRLSIRRKLPLLISALLCAAVGAVSWSAYHQLEGALVIAAGDRVVNVAQRLAGMLDESGRRLRRDVRQLSEDSTIVKFVVRPDAAARGNVQKTLERIRAAAAQLAWLEIRSRDGARLLAVGEPRIPPATLVRPEMAVVDTASQLVWIGPLVALSDTIYFRVVSPVVRSASDTIGWVEEYRRVSSAQGADALRGLIGTDAHILLGNRNGDVWTDLVKRVAGPPTPLKSVPPREYVMRDGMLRLGAAAIVPRTPWSVWIELPRTVILAPARHYLFQIVGIALLIIGLGALGAWLLSRHITAPLLEVTRASEDISGGDYSRRVSVDSGDELGSLARSFNRMAEQVEESKRELEARVASRTSELKEALDGLEHAQEELVRSERLAILGQLAGGVGHELRNPLGVMTNALYYLGMVLRDATPDVKEYLEILRTQVGLSEKIVGDLLDFARVKTPNREAISLEQLVADQLRRAGGTGDIRVASEFPPTLRAAMVDRVQIGQVVLNLITNAIQAMNGNGADSGAGGVLRLCGRMLDDHQIQLEVSDSGSGIKPEHLEKIFEPLFTTKARGIGLGLAVSRTLVRANGGDIRVVSRPGEGATFFVTLPVADPVVRAAAA